jgi:hypothetical protein
MYKADNEGEMVCLTEVGDMGLGVHKANNEQEREALRRKLEEMQQQNQKADRK